MKQAEWIERASFVALSQFVCNVEEVTERFSATHAAENFAALVEGGEIDAVIWEPFENTDICLVGEYIEDLRDSIVGVMKPQRGRL